MLLDAKDLALALTEMDKTNAPALSLDLLSDRESVELTRAARALTYKAGKDQVGSGDTAVYQDFLLTADWPDASPLMALERDLETLFQAANKMTDAPLLPPGFTFNDHIALFYPTGSKGITPHRDMTRFAGVILLLTLSGQAGFMTSDDRQTKQNVRTYDLRPGRLILLRGTAFGTSSARGAHGAVADHDDRPFHAVTSVEQERYCLGFRYDREL